MRRLCFVLLMLLAWTAPARSHEAAMAVLELHQVRPTEFIGNWALAPTFDPRYLHAQFPTQCHWEPPLLECGAPGFVGRVSFDNLGSSMSAVMLRIFPLQGATRTYTLSAATPSVTVLGESKPSLATWLELADTYLNLGVDHILLGIDHLLFVLGLIFIVRGGWRLAKTITAFTVGHSLSLAAAAFGLIGVPERPLNAVIALSIAFVAVEIARERQGFPGLTARHPWAVALGFGLVHGIGFAGALVSLGIERNVLPVALLSFNVGVEIGQLGFVLLILALFWAHRTLQAMLPRWGARVPEYAIGVPAMFWFMGRMARLVAS